MRIIPCNDFIEAEANFKLSHKVILKMRDFIIVFITKPYKLASIAYDWRLDINITVSKKVKELIFKDIWIDKNTRYMIILPLLLFLLVLFHL